MYTVDKRQGFTLVEVITAIVITGVLMGGLMTAGMVAANQLRVSHTDMQMYKASTYQMEKLVAQGYDSVVSGSGTVQSFDVAWTVTGTDPKRILLVIDRKTLRGQIQPDSFVTYISEGM